MAALRQAPNCPSLVSDELATALLHLASQLRGRLRDASVSIDRKSVV